MPDGTSQVDGVTVRREWLIAAVLAWLLAACRPEPTPVATLTLTISPTVTPSPLPTATPTATPTDTVTPTRTLIPSVTRSITPTPTITPTPPPSMTPTSTETPAPEHLAQLFRFNDVEGTRVDWGYARISYAAQNRQKSFTTLSITVAFQLADRAIHRRTIKKFGQDITVYYLNVRHEFNGQSQPMQLILGGTYGADIPLPALRADGSNYILVRKMSWYESFAPISIHQEAAEPLSSRNNTYLSVYLPDFEKQLAALPERLIVAADHAVLVDPDDWLQLYADMTRVAYLAARYDPWIELDAYDRITGHLPAANALANLVLYRIQPAVDVPAFSSAVLILITP